MPKTHVEFYLEIVFNAFMQQDLDPNEVYTEDYEDDGVPQNQGIKIDYNSGYIDSVAVSYNDNYNHTYQTPIYNYQDDYFDEEDEYKYLEEEREEEAAHLKEKQQILPHHNKAHQHQLQHQQHDLRFDEVRCISFV